MGRSDPLVALNGWFHPFSYFLYEVRESIFGHIIFILIEYIKGMKRCEYLKA